ncbi:15-hydroxyprostaglandin dehydrogenase [Trichonephila clavipes]|nr:15-hydroxyprostaglandin dehydrogenase [Trichonephila clavipes]
MASAVLADPTRALQGTNRGSGPGMEESKNDVGSLEQLLLYADEHYLAGKLPLGDHLGKVLHGVEEFHQRNVGPLRELTERALGFKIWFCKVYGNCLWNNCYAYVCSYRLTSHCGVHKCLPHNPSILSPRGLPGRSRPDFPRVGTFSCPLLPMISNRTLRTIRLASNTARRLACSFYLNDQASHKLA